MESKEIYDIAIIGAGAAGLGLAYRMSNHKYFSSKKILIIEPDDKKKNDRTWSYWSKRSNFYDDWAIKSWDSLTFSNFEKSKTESIRPYRYYTIKGIDYYEQCLAKISSSDNFTIVKDYVTEIKSEEQRLVINAKEKTYQAKLVFDSRIPDGVNFSKDHFVWQHFMGFVVETQEDHFNDNQALFMDFGIDQKNDTRFFYVLPYSKREALIEIAIFSNEIPKQDQYEKLINDYISKKYPNLSFTIKEKELDKIPMTTYDFPNTGLDNQYFIGKAAGMVKSSSGYAFKRIQDHLDLLVKCMVDDNNLLDAYTAIKKKKYALLDSTMMNVILTEKVSGYEVFSKLLLKNKFVDIFDFLEQDSSKLQEISIMGSLPKLPFIKGMWEELKP